MIDLSAKKTYDPNIILRDEIESLPIIGTLLLSVPVESCMYIYFYIQGYFNNIDLE